MAANVGAKTSLILGTAEKLIDLGWKAMRWGGSQPIYNTAKRTWNCLPEKVKTTVSQAWENPQYATAIKKTATCCASAFAGASAIAAASCLELGAVTTCGAAALAGGSAVFGMKNMDAKTAAKTAASVGAAGIASTAVAAIAMPVIGPLAWGLGTFAVEGAATGAGAAAAATILSATHPDEEVLINIPMGSPLELRTAGEDPGNPVHPEEALEALHEAALRFKQSHPNGMYSERLKTGVEDPEKVDNLTIQREKTDKQKEVFVEHVSTFVSAYFIFVNRLGLDLIPDHILMDMTQLALQKDENGEKVYSLWDACMLTLEKRNIELSFFQKLWAWLWYLLTDYLGIIPNMFGVIADKVLSQLRGGVEGDKSNVVITKILSKASSFLDEYNAAIESYAKAGQAHFPALKPEGCLERYQKEIIAKLGEGTSLANACEEMKPDGDLSRFSKDEIEKFGKLVMQELCKEFVAAIVDDPNVFPTIPVFKSLQKITLFGLRVGIIFDLLEWFIGGIINWIARKLVKRYVPDFVQSLVQKGIEQTCPDNYSFKIAIAHSLKDQVDKLKAQLVKGIPSTPLHFEDNNKLKETIAKLIKTLRLNTCPGDQGSLRTKFEELESLSPEDQQKQEILQKTTLKGAQLLIHYYTEQPEEIERLFERLFKLCTDPFKAGAAVYTKENYEAEMASFRKSIRKLVRAQVTEGVREKIRGETPEHIKTVLNGKRIDLKDQVELDRKMQDGSPLYPNQEGRPLYPDPEQRDSEGNLTYLLDKTGEKPIYKGLFQEQKEKAIATIQVLQGLVLKMVREIHADGAANLLEPGEVAPIARNEVQEEGLTELERRIAKEKAIIEQQIALLTAQITAVSEDEADRVNKLAALGEQKKLAEEELLLVGAMEEWNGLEPHNDHLLKNLENAMKMIDEFAEHVESLNLELYSEMIQKIFYRTFDPIYQAFVPITEQLIALQRLGKSFDKAKRLEEQFAEVVQNIRVHPNGLLTTLNKKLKDVGEIDKSFDGFESNAQLFVTPFKAFVDQLTNLSKERQKYEAIGQNLRKLGRFTDLTDEILSHPKDTIEKIRNNIPLEDHGPLFGAIAELQRKAKMSPIPNLTADHTAIQAALSAIVQKYTQKKQQNFQQERHILRGLSDWAGKQRVETEKKRVKAQGELLQGVNGLNKLKADTDALSQKIKHVKLSPMHFPVPEILPLIPFADWFVNRNANPYIDDIQKLINSAYDFITTKDISEAAARMTLGEYITAHAKR